MNIQNYVDAILHTTLFNGFPRDELLQLLTTSNCRLEVYTKGQIAHIQNERCESIDIILEGKLSVQKIDEGGNVLKVAVFTDSDIIGANLLFSHSNEYPLTIVSESKTVVLRIYKDLVLKLSQRNVTFMNGLLTAISNKALVLSEKIDTISLKTIRQRIIDFLKYEVHVQRSNVIKLHISKKDMAERLGIQRTSLSRELNKMRKDGLIEYDAKTITLKNLSVFSK